MRSVSVPCGGRCWDHVILSQANAAAGLGHRGNRVTSAWTGMCVDQLGSSVRLTHNFFFSLLLVVLCLFVFSFSFFFVLSFHSGYLQVEVSLIGLVIMKQRFYWRYGLNSKNMNLTINN